MSTTTKTRGRPRTRPAGSTARKWYATDAEFAAVAKLAAKAGLSVEEFVRRRVLGLGAK